MTPAVDVLTSAGTDQSGMLLTVIGTITSAGEGPDLTFATGASHPAAGRHVEQGASGSSPTGQWLWAQRCAGGRPLRGREASFLQVLHLLQKARSWFQLGMPGDAIASGCTIPLKKLPSVPGTVKP